MRDRGCTDLLHSETAHEYKPIGIHMGDTLVLLLLALSYGW